jgi:hypothetical protein
MTIERFLGATWAAIHGPRGARPLAVWTLESGFRGLMPGPAPREIAWEGLRALRREMPFQLVEGLSLGGARSGRDRPDRGLGSQHRGDRTTAVAAVQGALERARALGIRRVLVEPGAVSLPDGVDPVDVATASVPEAARDRAVAARDRGLDGALDAACRSLHSLCKANPDMELCLVPGRGVESLGSLVGLRAIFDDLQPLPLGYWHEAAVAAGRQEFLGEPQGAWLEQFGSLLRGLSVADRAEGSIQMPPGSGLVDYPLLTNYVPRAASGVFPVVVDLDPGVPPVELPGVHAFLDRLGL